MFFLRLQSKHCLTLTKPQRFIFLIAAAAADGNLSILEVTEATAGI